MAVQYRDTFFDIEDVSGVKLPAARTISTEHIFSELSSAAATAGASDLETQIWKLASILFDRHDPPTSSAPSSVSSRSTTSPHIPDSIRARYRKDLLINYWKDLIAAEVNLAVRQAATPEDRAFAYLTGGDLVAACAALVEGRDHKLATLIAQLPANAVFKDGIARQIKGWEDLNIISEFSDVMRAMYGILAGQMLRCEGKSGAGVPIEDRASSFYLSERFDMSWRRAFGLRLFWGVLKEEDLSEAVVQYLHDLGEGGEPAVPLLEGDDAAEDPLWSTLQVFAQTRVQHVSEDDVGLLTPEMLDWRTALPEDSDRVAFQLTTLLAAQKDNIQFGNDDLVDNIIAEGPVLPVLLQRVRQELKDGDEQHSCALLFRAVYSALHIKSPVRRSTVLFSISQDNADLLVRFNCGHDLQLKLGVPARWIGDARAKIAREKGDVEEEVEGLIEAGETKRAMERVFGEILPGLAVRGDLKGMKRVLGGSLLPFVGEMDQHTGSSQKKVSAKYKGDLDFYIMYLAVVDGKTKTGAGGQAALVKKFKSELEQRKGALDGIAWRVMGEQVDEAMGRRGYN
jgi:nuclear pore complex protein Nup98-Nup96